MPRIRTVAIAGASFIIALVTLIASAEEIPPIPPPTLPEIIAPAAEADITTIEAPETAADLTFDSAPPALSFLERFSTNYYMIFFGPSLKKPSSYQPKSNGEPDTERPLFIKNFFTVGYSASEAIGLSATLPWLWKPVRGHQVTMRDPYARVVAPRLLNYGPFNLYSDLRVHFAVSNESRDMDLLTGLQTFHTISFQPGQGRLTLGTNFSVRYNVFGSQGVGNDLEIYVGPTLNYKLTRTLTATFLYEMGASRAFNDPKKHFYSDGTDFEPGILWDITPSFSVNPYLNLITSEKVTWKSTSFGMTLSWTLY